MGIKTKDMPFFTKYWHPCCTRMTSSCWPRSTGLLLLLLLCHFTPDVAFTSRRYAGLHRQRDSLPLCLRVRAHVNDQSVKWKHACSKLFIMLFIIISSSDCGCTAMRVVTQMCASLPKCTQRAITVACDKASEMFSALVFLWAHTQLWTPWCCTW